MPSRYELRLNKRAQKGWEAIKGRDPAGAREVEQFLRTSPELRVPGKVKKLRGELRGLLQYDVNRSDRVWYRVDRENSIVWVEYAGSHP